MSYSSPIHRHEIIIGDENEYTTPDFYQRGLELNLREAYASAADYAYEGVADRFDPAWLVPQSEWEARIKEMTERKLLVSDLIDFYKIPEKDQGPTNFCWMYGPVQCQEVVMCKQNETYVDLCATSAACRVKGFRNVGGWGKEAIMHLQDLGVTSTKLWKNQAIDRKYDTAEAKQEALLYRVNRWIETQPRNLEQMVSMLLRGYPGAFGYNWWRHEIMGCDLLWLDGEVALRIRNQWKGWGNRNFGILRGSKMLPDDAVYPVSITATKNATASTPALVL